MRFLHDDEDGRDETLYAAPTVRIDRCPYPIPGWSKLIHSPELTKTTLRSLIHPHLHSLKFTTCSFHIISLGFDWSSSVTISFPSGVFIPFLFWWTPFIVHYILLNIIHTYNSQTNTTNPLTHSSPPYRFPRYHFCTTQHPLRSPVVDTNCCLFPLLTVVYPHSSP